MPLLMCPNCNASMTEVKRDDVAFDMCPTCRGVWLDRGELEKIIAGAQGRARRFRAGPPPVLRESRRIPPLAPAQQQPSQQRKATASAANRASTASAVKAATTSAAAQAAAAASACSTSSTEAVCRANGLPGRLGH